MLISEIKCSFFENINITDKSLVRMTKENENRHKLTVSGIK